MPIGLQNKPFAKSHGNTHPYFNLQEKMENVIDYCENLEDGHHVGKEGREKLS